MGVENNTLTIASQEGKKILESQSALREIRYKQNAQVLIDLAEYFFQRRLPEETSEAWIQLFHTGGKADEILDALPSKSQRKNLTDNSISYLTDAIDQTYSSGNERLDLEMSKLKKFVGNLPPEKKDWFIESLSNLMSRSEEIRNETSIFNYQSLVGEEGELTTDMLYPFLPDELLYSDEGEKFASAVTLIGRGSNIFDALKDIAHDFDSGEGVLEPTIKNRLVLAGVSLTISAQAVRQLGLRQSLSVGLHVAKHAKLEKQSRE